MRCRKMNLIRAFLARHRAVAVLLIAAALCMKAVVPAGYMLHMGDRVMTVAICADAQGGQLTRQIVLPGSGKSHEGTDGSGKADSTCPFSALSFASMSGADPVLLASVLIFILALGFAALDVTRPVRKVRLRPPLRGPPLLA